MKTGTREVCELCGSSMRLRRASAEAPYRYDMSGLDNVYLVGIDILECSTCDVREPIIPKIGELNKTIAKHLLLKEQLLSGNEIRFLRKNAGLSATQFAALLEIDPSHLSRIENGKTVMGTGSDKLARAIVAAAGGGAHIRNILLRAATQKIEVKRTIFGLAKNHWEKLAA